MNILFVSPTPFHPERGGVGRVTDILCKEFQKNGHNVFYLNLSWYQDERKNYIYPTKVNIFPNPNIYCKTNVAFYNKFLEDNSIDIIINQDGLSDNSKLFLNVDNPKIKKISVFHNNPFNIYNNLWDNIKSLRNKSIKEKFKRFVRCLLYFKIKKTFKVSLKRHFDYIYKNSDSIVLLSDEYKNKLESFSQELNDKLFVINNPNSFDQPSVIPEKDNTMLYVGRLSNKEKRIDRLIDIWESISKKYTNWEFYIVGDGKDREYLEKYAKDKKIRNIRFVGSSNPVKYYQKSSIVCLSSDYEGLPMTLIEGMQFGCVPICFDSFDSAHEIIKNGVTGELVKPYNNNEYRCKLENLISDSSYRKQISLNAFNSSIRYDKTKIVEDWYRLFDKI